MGKKRNSLIVILFFIGFAVMLYPLISRTYYDYRGNEEVTAFQEGLDQISSAESQDQLREAQAYNNALLSGDMTPQGDPFSEEEKESGLAEYARFLEVREKLGVLTIPKIDMKFPVYAGTSEPVLQRGVGHLEGTSLPIGGLNTNSILTAHRGLPENKLFTDLDQMELDDLFFVETAAGQLAYEVSEIKVIEPTEIEALRIEHDRDLITLLTCTPYMVNSHRLLVIGERTELPTEEIGEATSMSWWRPYWSIMRDYIWLLLIILAVSSYFIGKTHYLKKRRV